MNRNPILDRFIRNSRLKTEQMKRDRDIYEKYQYPLDMQKANQNVLNADLQSRAHYSKHGFPWENTSSTALSALFRNPPNLNQSQSFNPLNIFNSNLPTPNTSDPKNFDSSLDPLAKFLQSIPAPPEVLIAQINDRINQLNRILPHKQYSLECKNSIPPFSTNNLSGNLNGIPNLNSVSPIGEVPSNTFKPKKLPSLKKHQTKSLGNSPNKTFEEHSKQYKYKPERHFGSNSQDARFYSKYYEGMDSSKAFHTTIGLP